MRSSFKNAFSFEYGPLDDKTYWIQTPSKKLININKITLDIMLKLNEGIALQEILNTYDISKEEIDEMIDRMEKEGAIVDNEQGKIAQAKTIPDIRISPYFLLWISLVLVQIWYFRYISQNYLMKKWQEGVAILIIAFIATLGHEIGHYLVSRKYFEPKFGFTFLLGVFPAIYVNTQESWKLPKGIRILINLSGSLVDLIVNTFAILFVLCFPKLEYYVTPFLMTQFSRWALVINPLFPTDFYWILSDVTKIVNLSQKAKEDLFRLRPSLLSLYALLSYVVIVFSLYWFGTYIFSILMNIFDKVYR